MQIGNILIVDDDEGIRRSFTSVVNKMGLTAITVGTGKEAIEFVKNKDFFLAFLDLRLPDISGIKILRKIRDKDPNIVVIMITGYATMESAIEAIDQGAYDYIKKPFKSDAIKIIIKLAMEKHRLSKEIGLLQHEKVSQFSADEDEMVGSCDIMVNLGKQIAKVARTDINILIQAESGTGKELIANIIHKKSDRASQPLIHINCSAIPKDLLESEFFGHEKGAFTGAENIKMGLFEQANGGTLHLDELGDMDLSLQAKLLRVLESHSLRRVGGTKEINVDVRIIASTNKNLPKEIKNGEFRSDLYYRLNSFPIKLPLLKERGEDIILLSMYYIKKYNYVFNKNIMHISSDVKKLLLSYSWPGNVRELKNIIEKAMILISESANKLLPEHIHIDYEEKNQTSSFLDYQIEHNESKLQFDGVINFEQVITDITNQVKKKIIDRALSISGGNKTKASKMLQINRSALWREMEKIKHWKKKNSSHYEQ